MKKVLIAGALGVAALVAWRGLGSSGDTTEMTVAHDDELVFDRLWIDHLPKNERDPIKVFVAIDDEAIGLFQTASMWQGAYELFKYEAHDGEIRAVFPQKGDREKITAHATKCNTNRMDYCLELKGSSRGTKHYYSMKGWEVGAADQRQMLDHVTRLTAQLPVE